MKAFDWTYIKRAPKGRPVRRCGALLLGTTWLLAACGSTVASHWPHFLQPYRPDVQQGNVITSDMVDQLRPGMTRDQVKFMLGTPLLTDEFHPDRWDYLYYLNPRSGAPQRRNLVVYFKDNKLDHFTSDPMPPESMADNLILGRKGSDRPTAPPKQPAGPPAPAAGSTPAPESTPAPQSPPAPQAPAPSN
jgi:outer membrane protein assembly factor BamE